ncbi:PAS domain-containing protein [Ferrovibrio sp.]|uniref:PAS domain-containing protein n=1 Tax=Ferrovibrio sp. TaxID=1917215 RepID=UPI003511EB82
MTAGSLATPDSLALPDAAVQAHSGFVRLHAYWLARIIDGRLPGRAQIDPLEMPRDLLPHIVLFEVVTAADGARRYRFRLMGSAIAAIPGRDDTGRFYDETIAPDLYQSRGAGLDAIVDSGRPGYAASAHAAPDREHIHVGRLGLPLASDGRTVDMILGILLPLPRPD